MRNITFTLKFEVSGVKEEDFRKQCEDGFRELYVDLKEFIDEYGEAVLNSERTSILTYGVKTEKVEEKNANN